MNDIELVLLGNDLRSQDRYDEALRCYGEAFLQNSKNIHAWNNYGNVLREIGEPARARPFLEHAIVLDPTFVHAQFNLAISSLLAGDYELGFRQYEWRWQYEHLAGTKPVSEKPEWIDQPLTGRTILVIGEQGFGDCIQFIRFTRDLAQMGAAVIVCCLPGLVPLFTQLPFVKQVITSLDANVEYDYWISIMSLPLRLGITRDNLRQDQLYLGTDSRMAEEWRQRFGPKQKMRVGLAWSGRPDSWANRYKQLPLNHVAELVQQNPGIDWISLQVEPTEESNSLMQQLGVLTFPGTIKHWGDTSALVYNLDLVITVDTSIAHLAGAMGRPTWIPLTKFAVDWRWGVDTDTSPWYPTVRLFRQPNFGDWTTVIAEINRFLQYFKI